MNIRTRMQERALMQRKNIPIMATLEIDDGPYGKEVIVFIHPDDWDEFKRMYGDKLQLVLEDLRCTD